MLLDLPCCLSIIRGHGTVVHTGVGVSCINDVEIRTRPDKYDFLREQTIVVEQNGNRLRMESKGPSTLEMDPKQRRYHAMSASKPPRSSLTTLVSGQHMPYHSSPVNYRPV